MLDGINVHFLFEPDAIGADIKNGFTPGFSPTNTQLRTTQSRTAPSTNPLSVVAPDETYFIGSDVHGTRFYSRNGDFRMVDGTLRTPNGSAVMGFASGSTALGPLKIDPKDAALGLATNAQVEADGSLTYSRPVRSARTGAKETERVVAGRIALARFPAGTELPRLRSYIEKNVPAGHDVHSTDGVHFAAPDTLAPTIGKPNEIGFRPLMTHRVDRGQLDLKLAMSALRDEYTEWNILGIARKAKGNDENKAIALLK